MTLTLHLTGYATGTDRVTVDADLPLTAAHALRAVFDGLPEIFPYFFDAHPVTTPAQKRALQAWCPHVPLDAEGVAYFLEVITP